MPSLLTAMDIDRHSASDRDEPWTELSSGVERLRGAPCLHERLLRRVFGQLTIAERAVRHAEDESAVFAIDGAHRVWVAIPKSRQRLDLHGSPI